MSAYVIAVFLSSFLVFLVQPLVGKYILPWFGGSPGVWTACLLFFQLMLVAGYAYAHLLTTWLHRSRQVIAHLLVLGLSLLFLPMIPSSTWRSATVEHPTGAILALLGFTVGPLYLVLAASAPLLQSWFSVSFPNRSPYRLYAVSNVASLGALLSYPFALERALYLRQQCHFWSLLYLAFALAIGICGFVVHKKWKAGSAAQVLSGSANLPPLQPLSVETPTSQTDESRSPSVLDSMLWLVLSACGTIMLMATTNQITQDVVPVPFLWILPLSLYLLTFIICFDRPGWYVRDVYIWLFVVSLILLVIRSYIHQQLQVHWQIAAYSLNLFAACMCCHGELVARRPVPQKLTHFYLSVAIGGALGGCAVALAAPMVFNDFHEFVMGNIAIILLLLVCGRITDIEQLVRRHGKKRAVVVGMAAAMSVGGLLVAVSSVANDLRNGNGSFLVSARNFYGVIKVQKNDTDQPSQARILMSHGTTMHGWQFLDDRKARTPTSYYEYDGGVGKAILKHPKRQSDTPMKIGVIGLGVGTLSAYARPRDEVVFYEINPLVIQLCEAYFSFIRLAKADGASITVHLGDARLLMEQELNKNGSRRFDVLVVDAFTSDSIPMHLLTRECFDLYWQHLAPDGVLAVHVSNRHVNLQPVVYQHAHRRQVPALLVKRTKDPSKQTDAAVTPSEWVLMTTDTSLTCQLRNIEGVTELDGQRHGNLPEWTDNYSSLWGVLR